MKTSKIITLAMVALALCATPALAQRHGGGGSRGGGSHSSSMGSSRSGSSFSGSSSRSGSSFSGSSSRSSSSYSSPRSSSTHSSPRSSNSYSAPSRSGGDRSVHSPAPAPSRGGAAVHSGGAPSRSGMAPRGEGGRPAPAVRGEGHRPAPAVRGAREAGVTGQHRAAPGGEVRRGTPGGGPGRPGGVREGGPAAPRSGVPGSGPRVSSGRANDVTPYARPGRPGGAMPPSHRPIHPAPYFHHPWHGGYVHCHPIIWDPIPPRPWYWPGFWLYCNSYWYDYHVTNVAVVHDYVQNKYNVDLVTYGISGDIMYAIVRDGGTTYLQVYDKDDHLMAEQKINRKYCNMVIDSENGGCWISKKDDKDPLLFIWADGQLLIYEAD